MGKSFTARRLAAALLLLLPLLAPLQVLGAGLGKLTVLSALGQPLAAEIEIVALQAGEEESLAARIASQDAFRQASVEFNPALLAVRFALDRRAGRTVLKLSSSQPISEPFLEMLVELSWNTGRLVREYTFLLDPPEYKGVQPIAQAPAAAPRLAPTPAVKPVPAPAPRSIEERPMAAQPSPATATGTKGTYEVKKGDTLAKIATQTKPPSVTLQQMLMALYRANPDAFIGSNINRLRAGRILNLPDEGSAKSIDQEDARRLVAAQSQDFRDYQGKLAGAVAGAPAEAAAARREASGKITPPPEAPKTAEPKDQLKLSKAEPGAKGAQSKAARADNLAAREKALKDTESRIADLEKSVRDLQNLVELKNQALAELEKKGAARPAPAAPVPAKPAPVAETPKPAAPGAPVPAKPAAIAEAPKPAAEAPKPALEPAKPAPAEAAKAPAAPKPPAEAAKAPEAPKPPADAAKAPEMAKPVAEPPKPAADAPKPKPPSAPPPPPPPPPPSLVDEFLDNPAALGGLGLVLLLLIGYGWWAWRRKKASQTKFQDSVMGASPSSLGASSVFSGAPAAAETPDAGVGVGQVSVSDASVNVGDSDEVDPIAEADVYMAYGRDAQAEEILKDALGKDPNRLAIHSKLVEIYAGRRDTQNLEQSVMKVKDLTGGQGPDWDKAAALGRSVDPSNALYGGDGSAAPGFDSTVILQAGSDAGAAPTLDFDLDAATPTAPAPDIALEAGPQESPGVTVDFDLGAGDTPAAPAKDEATTDFSPGATVVIDTKETESASGGLDFDLGMDSEPKAPEPPTVPEPPAPVAPATAGGGGLDFDLELNLDGDKPAAPAPEPAAQPLPEMDMSSISFDLGTPGEAAPAAEGDARWQEVATKLDLAKAYEEMGDKDGARDLLNEVAKEGDAAQQKQAQDMLSKLG